MNNKCYDCQGELTKQEEEFGLCASCEDIRASKQEEDYQKERHIATCGCVAKGE